MSLAVGVHQGHCSNVKSQETPLDNTCVVKCSWSTRGHGLPLRQMTAQTTLSADVLDTRTADVNLGSASAGCAVCVFT